MMTMTVMMMVMTILMACSGLSYKQNAFENVKGTIVIKLYLLNLICLVTIRKTYIHCMLSGVINVIYVIIYNNNSN